jgi:hypothetical protein
MSNTVISLKKSSTPSAEPTILANGELAINYADGKLFYKNANGTILPFNTTGGNAFGTVNANGTLVVAGTSEAILTLISGNNIYISADDINDTITISANIAPAYDKANSALPNTSGVSFSGDLFFPTGNIAIGNNSASYPLDVNGNINSSNTVFAVHFDNVSDISLKDNVLPLDNITKTLNQLNPVSFTWKNNGQKSYGLIAQEVEQILPTIVHTKSDGTKTVNYIEIIAFLIAEVKSLRQEIDVINTINNKSKESS